MLSAPCIFGPPRCASGDGPLPPQWGEVVLVSRFRNRIGRRYRFPDAETGGALGLAARGFLLRFWFSSFTSSVEGLAASAYCFELTTLASPIVGFFRFLGLARWLLGTY